MKPKADTYITMLLILCAIITTALVVRRELFTRMPNTVIEQRSTYISDWHSHLSEGTRFGPAEAPIQLVEFADFECPFCATFNKTLKALRERYPTQVAVTFVDFPLPMHRFAEPAARVTECAGRQGRFEAMHDVLFSRQQDFGLKPWSEFAATAGVPDEAAFGACIKSTDTIQRVAKGKALGAKLNVEGTPTVLVNGWKLGQPPSLEELDAMVKRILAGKDPVKST